MPRTASAVVAFHGSDGVPERRKRQSARAIGHAAATTSAPPMTARTERGKTAPATPIGNNRSSPSPIRRTPSAISGGGAITPAVSRAPFMPSSRRPAPGSRLPAAPASRDGRSREWSPDAQRGSPPPFRRTDRAGWPRPARGRRVEDALRDRRHGVVPRMVRDRHRPEAPEFGHLRRVKSGRAVQPRYQDNRQAFGHSAVPLARLRRKIRLYSRVLHCNILTLRH